MGLWPRRAVAALEAVHAAPVVTAAETFPGSSNVYQITTGMPVEVAGIWDATVSRDLAASVPAVLRGVTLLTTTAATLPIERQDGSDPGWVAQPEAGRTAFATWTDIGRDLIYDGRGYLRVWERDAQQLPALGGTEYLSLTRCGDQVGPDGRPTLTVDGKIVDRRDVIGFEGWHDGILKHGARLIKTALALEAAARRYADSPMPAVTLVSKSGVPLDTEEIDALIRDYKASRNQEGVGYVNDMVDVVPTGFDAAQLQLIEGRQYLGTQIANLIGLPASAIAGAAAQSGGSLTYANVNQENRSLIDYGLKCLLAAIESRLSLPDVNGRNAPRRFNLDALLRGDALQRAQVYQILVPLGVLTAEQAATMEDLAPTGVHP
jgi:hypothetical protein